MLKQVFQRTNKRRRREPRNRGKNLGEWVPVDMCQMKCIVGVLYLIGVNRSQDEYLCSLWSSGSSGKAIFPASFDRYQFEQLTANPRFDSCKNRNAIDKFSPFRRRWKKFIENCRKYYAVGTYVTVYEQITPFRGCSSFMHYMPNKPKK